MVITDGTERKQARPGLIDSRGMFVLLVDDDETAYYRFSGESEAIAALLAECDALRAKVESLHDALDRMARARDKAQQMCGRLRDGIQDADARAKRYYERARRYKAKLDEIGGGAA